MTGRRPVALATLTLGLALVAACDGDGDETTPETTPERSDERPPGPRVFPLDLAPVLDDPGRDAWQHPDEVVAALRIRPGDRVADVGCGTGYFTLRLLRAAGATGHVIAVDIQQGMLDRLEARLGRAEREHVTLRRTAPDRPLQAGDACDLVLCANTLHEVDDADTTRFVKSMADGLAPGGRLALVNWKAIPTRFGPPLDHRIPTRRIRELAEAAGLLLAEDLDLLPMHSFLVFTKPRH